MREAENRTNDTTAEMARDGGSGVLVALPHPKSLMLLNLLTPDIAVTIYELTRRACRGIDDRSGTSIAGVMTILRNGLFSQCDSP
jgi:hypothetical protein